MIGDETLPSEWKPVPPPARGERDAAKLNEFHAYILTPGFSLAFHAATLNRSLTSIATYRGRALQAAQANPDIMDMVRARVQAITASDGVGMARLRGTAQLPYWSRVSVIQHRKQGRSRCELAALFRCGVGTINNVLQCKGSSWAPFSGDRQLTDAQSSPPGKWLRSLPVLL